MKYHIQTIILIMGHKIDHRILDIKNINRIKTELNEVAFTCKKVLKQLEKVNNQVK